MGDASLLRLRLHACVSAARRRLLSAFRHIHTLPVAISTGVSGRLAGAGRLFLRVRWTPADKDSSAKLHVSPSARQAAPGSCDTSSPLFSSSSLLFRRTPLLFFIPPLSTIMVPDAEASTLFISCHYRLFASLYLGPVSWFLGQGVVLCCVLLRLVSSAPLISPFPSLCVCPLLFFSSLLFSSLNSSFPAADLHAYIHAQPSATPTTRTLFPLAKCPWPQPPI